MKNYVYACQYDKEVYDYLKNGLCSFPNSLDIKNYNHIYGYAFDVRSEEEDDMLSAVSIFRDTDAMFSEAILTEQPSAELYRDCKYAVKKGYQSYQEYLNDLEETMKFREEEEMIMRDECNEGVCF